MRLFESHPFPLYSFLVSFLSNKSLVISQLELFCVKFAIASGKIKHFPFMSEALEVATLTVNSGWYKNCGFSLTQKRFHTERRSESWDGRFWGDRGCALIMIEGRRLESDSLVPPVLLLQAMLRKEWCSWKSLGHQLPCLSQNNTFGCTSNPCPPVLILSFVIRVGLYEPGRCFL